MKRDAIRSSEAPAPAGSYSQAVRAQGHFVFLSGQTPRTLEGERPSGAPFAEQARLALDNLNAVAQAGGLTLRDAVKVNVYLRDAAHAAEFDRIYRTYVDEPLPARTLTISAFTGFDIEVDAILFDGGR
jgi:reactive intermediate/imine deaminase